jgi:hypothetical protein
MDKLDNDPRCLTAGLDPEQQTELGDLSQLESALYSYETLEPATNSEQLLACLQPFLSQNTVTSEVAAAQNTTVSSNITQTGWRYWLELAQSQLSLVDGTFLWASALLLGVGVILSFSSEGVVAATFALLSPVLAVAGTAYIFRPEAKSLREFELLSAVSPLELLYARVLLILTYNAGLSLTLILIAWSQDTQLALWRLLLVWFGPMLGLTSIALYASLRWNMKVGIIAPMSLWASLIFLGWRETVSETNSMISLFDIYSLAVTQSDILLIASMLGIIIGLVLIHQSRNWIDASQ